MPQPIDQHHSVPESQELKDGQFFDYYFLKESSHTRAMVEKIKICDALILLIFLLPSI